MFNMRLAALTTAAALSCAGLLLASPTGARAQSFTATAGLFGTNEVPANTSSAIGSAIVSFDGVSTLTYTVSFINLSSNATASHIHFGAVGTAGPVILPFTNQGPPAATSGVFSGTLTAANLIASPANGINTFTDALNAIRAGNTYVNVHSVNFPGGEIRGQLTVPAAAPEPGSLSLLAVAAISAGGVGLRRRTRRKAV